MSDPKPPEGGESDVSHPRPPTGRRATARTRPRGSLRPRPGTLLAVSVAGLAAVLTWADPFAQPEDGVLLVNNRSGGRRVFPTLVDADPGKATIELQAPDGPAVRVVPTPEGGHQLLHGDTVLGPVTNEDFDGLWSSLRLATAQRTATHGQGVGQRGVIRISLPDETLTLALGDAVPGGGIYGAFEVDGDTWVVETEMLTLVEQSPRSWIGKRLLPVEVDAVTSLGWADELVLSRANDGFWRVRAGEVPALLGTSAVEFHLRRLLRAPIDPFIDRSEIASDSLRPWVVVTTIDGSSRALLVGDACPGYPRKRIVDRGAGLLGCIPGDLLERWPVVEPQASMVESRLVPHDYGRIVGFDLEVPVERGLIRRGGAEWSYVADDGAGERSVAEEEVRRWFGSLSEIEVALYALEPGLEVPERDPDASPDKLGGSPEPLGDVGLPSFEPDWTLVVHVDSGEALRVSCALTADPDQPRLCIRDGGPLLRLLADPPRNLAFDQMTFARRNLTALSPGELRQLEILPPEDSDSSTVRQSVHADMGAWELDAPVHVDDSGAIDLVRLENLLWALRQLRAEAWVEPPSDTPLRRIVAEVVPEQGRRYTLRLSLFPNCVVEVQGQRPAAVSEAQCAALNEDLMFDDPLRFWIERSRSFEVRGGGEEILLHLRDQQFVDENDAPVEDGALEAQLRSWIAWRSQGIRAGEAPGKVKWKLDVRRDFGPTARIEIGQGWARIAGADWYYLEREAGVEPLPEQLPGAEPRDPAEAIDPDQDPVGSGTTP